MTDGVITSKRCSRCKLVLDLSRFSKNWRSKSGYRSRCKSCGVFEAGEWYKRNKLASKIYHDKWKRTEAGIESKRRSNARREREQPWRGKAVRAVNNAIRDRRLFRGPCEVCGTTERVQGHHDDYSKPLDVRWLCFKHHLEFHGKQILE